MTYLWQLSLLCCWTWLPAPACASASTLSNMVQVPPGLYENQNYGFSIEIPATVKAYRDTPPNPNHGILIALGKGRRLFASANFDVLDFGSSKTQLDDMLAGSGKLLKREQVPWAGLPAEQASLQKGHQMILLRAQYRADGKILYELRLESTRAAFAKDKILFDQIAHSFKRFPRN